MNPRPDHAQTCPIRATDLHLSLGTDTVLISNHQLADVERLASHLAFMHDGRIQLFGERDARSEHLRLLECAPAQVRAELSA